MIEILSASQAVERGIYVVRAFVRLRQATSIHNDLATRHSELEDKTERLELSHDPFSRNTRRSAQAGLRCTARTHDPTGPAQAAHSKNRQTQGLIPMTLFSSELSGP